MQNDENRTMKTLLPLLVGGVLLLTGCREPENDECNSNTVMHMIESAHDDVSETQKSPQIPNFCVFAGDTIRLDREDMKERMDRELIAFTYSHSTSLLMLKRSPKYFPAVEKILHEEGLPDDLKYLMVIESNLDPNITSSAGAAGLWQFTAATGKEYGLEINSNIDERYNIEKSTRAACSFMKVAYEKYGDWLTVAASYNAGQNRITREREKQHQKKGTDLWLPSETSRYMFRLLAAKMMFENPMQFGFNLKEDELYRPIQVKETITLNCAISDLAQFAKKHGTTYYELRSANLWLREMNLQNKSHRTYHIIIPE